ncbi:Rab-specific(Ryh1/Ypt6) Ric1-Rgp1 guanyl-nucleotide exchange factor subunit Rgp1/Sat1 [Schizosaccharomyces osmophilus]|uniref:Rab-specific(Ryh1/Ypt6) Ric1-Rgp1 guanyl-nucleotide exchange factor subunit Rgp1/Sat1 n=1 Tax=Schizosaccharomyces osmophilus TaxID=2545709 RepID=A0AAF0AVY5_9SCHI|nr:Rab-specific(Ryh1/Ypt6) Ric1-Rgp1 guanyl-nucleotide exchange factor subunit Rgp1/Sat1 [Schizosaccharomyces osmophilus]WBW72515.1 Rab-specific(Ryh1/Ypt6) Ric1-Rgp1 guanyl-nucleotide exchange factor subunit Rgp1/Sat1 [Schizosaccharomyces osmophilus]
MSKCQVEIKCLSDVVQVGETFDCIVKITNSKTAQSALQLLLCYASIHGEMYLDPTLVRVSEFENVQRQGLLNKRTMSGLVHIPKASTGHSVSNALSGMFGTLLGLNQASTLSEASEQQEENATPVYMTRPDILGVDMVLAPGESKWFRMQRKIPLKTVPSYKGVAFEFQHKLVVGAQFPDNNACVEYEFGLNFLPNSKQRPDLPLGKFSQVPVAGPDVFADVHKPIFDFEPAKVKEQIDETWMQEERDDSGNGKKKLEQFLATLMNVEGSAYAGEGEDEREKKGKEEAESKEEEREEEKEKERSGLLRRKETPGRMTTRYEIANQQKLVCRILFNKSKYVAGEMMLLEVNEMGGAIRQLHVQLESVERIVPKIRMRNSTNTERVTRRIWTKLTRCVYGLDNFSCTMSIPEECPTTFETQQFGVEHFLRIEFLRDTSERERFVRTSPRDSKETMEKDSESISTQKRNGLHEEDPEKERGEQERKGQTRSSAEASTKTSTESGHHSTASITNAREMRIEHAPAVFPAETIQCCLPARIEHCFL